MSINIIVDKPADGGNVFLCPLCSHVVIRSSRFGQEYLCGKDKIAGYSNPAVPVTAEITQCSEYQPKDLYHTDSSKELTRMKMQAWYVEPSKERDGEFVFLPKVKWDAY